MHSHQAQTQCCLEHSQLQHLKPYKPWHRTEACIFYPLPYSPSVDSFHPSLPFPILRAMLCANWALLDRLFRTAAAFLEEGSLETRTHGKRLLFEIRATVPARPDWERLLGALRPEALQRKVVEVLEAPGGPPPPPSRGRMGE